MTILDYLEVEYYVARREYFKYHHKLKTIFALPIHDVMMLFNG
jgi:hypothetical protein